jgi:hypothetical protein
MKRTLLTVLILTSAMTLLGQEKAPGKFSGYMFGDYSYNVARDTGIANMSNLATSGSKDFNVFQLRRIYFAYDNDISTSFMTRLRFEASSGVAPLVKDAYVRWKNVFEGSDLFFGVQPTPAFDISEAAWGYRSLEKTIMDLRGIVSSRDLGVSLKGRIDQNGMVNYWLMYGNNSSTNAETDKYKRLYANVQVKPIDNLQVTLYGDYSMKAQINNPNSTTNPRATLSNDMVTGALFVGYSEKDKYSAGLEGFYQSTQNGYIIAGTPATVKDKIAEGVSLFATYNLQSDLVLIGRYDYFEPNSDSKSTGDVRNYVIAGVNWKLDKNVWLMPNIQYETYETKPASGAVASHSYDPSITGRITFYYVFL